MKRLLALLFPPKPLPAPHPSCRVCSEADRVQRIKNHDTARRISAAHH